MTDNITALITEARQTLVRPDGADLIYAEELLMRDLADALEAEHKRAERVIATVWDEATNVTYTTGGPEVIEVQWLREALDYVGKDALPLREAEAERDRYRAEAESARKTGERILADALRYRTALERIDTELRGDGRSSVLIVIAQEIIYDALNEGAADV